MIYNFCYRNGRDELSWYHMDKNFIHLSYESYQFKRNFQRCYNLINQHDTFIEIDVKKKFRTVLYTNRN